MQAITHPIIGFRAWFSEPSGILRSTVQQWHWQPGTNEAQCLRHIHLHRDAAPASRCECGLYAFHDHDKAIAYDDEDGIVGIVRGWGHVEVHRDGWRSQYAEVLAIVEAPGTDSVRAAWAAERYGVPLLHHSALPGVAREFGQVVPPELRPDTPVFASSRGLGIEEELASLAYVFVPVIGAISTMMWIAQRLYRWLRK